MRKLCVVQLSKKLYDRSVDVRKKWPQASATRITSVEFRCGAHVTVPQSNTGTTARWSRTNRAVAGTLLFLQLPRVAPPKPVQLHVGGRRACHSSSVAMEPKRQKMLTRVSRFPARYTGTKAPMPTASQAHVPIPCIEAETKTFKHRDKFRDHPGQFPGNICGEDETNRHGTMPHMALPHASTEKHFSHHFWTCGSRKWHSTTIKRSIDSGLPCRIPRSLGPLLA